MNRKMLLIAVGVAGAALAGAAPGGYGQGDVETAGSGYPPCSRTVTDRCIQLHERGVRSRENLAMNTRLGPGRVAPPMMGGEAMQAGMGGPIEDVPVAPMVGDPAIPREAYPPCTRTITDRCIQLYERSRR